MKIRREPHTSVEVAGGTENFSGDLVDNAALVVLLSLLVVMQI